MRLDGLLRAHGFLKVERPPELWEADTGLEIVPLLGEMIAASLRHETLDLAELTLNASNMEVPEDYGPHGPPAGQFVALTVSGPVPRQPDTTWSPAAAPNGFFASVLEHLLAAKVRYAYIRDMRTRGSITVFLSRLT
jgi:hypothetical protein